MIARIALSCLLLSLSGCGATGTLSFDSPLDDDDVGADDDDSTAGDDDDSTAGDDDDSTAGDDDDSTAGDDDDSTAGDDDDDDDDDDDGAPCPSDVITCGGVATSNNAVGSSVIDSNSCAGDGMTGPEVGYLFAATEATTVTATLQGLTGDLDLYVLAGSSCDPDGCIDGSWNGGNDSEEVAFEVSLGDTVTLFVDGWDNAVSDYTLAVSCDGDDGDDDDDSVGTDNDGDGWDDGPDCDDTDPAVNPGATEACDGVDNDCAGGVDDGACPGCVQGSFAGHTYQVCAGFTTSWGNASVACSSVGYYLTTIDDAAENAYLAGLAGSLGVGGGWWFGYTDAGAGNEGNWDWTGTPAAGSYTNWNGGEPNNFGNEDCAEMGPGSGWAWNDLSCGSNNAFLCEGDF